MSGITAVSGNNSSLLALLAQADAGQSDPTLVDSLIASEDQASTQDTATTSATTGAPRTCKAKSSRPFQRPCKVLSPRAAAPTSRPLFTTRWSRFFSRTGSTQKPCSRPTAPTKAVTRPARAVPQQSVDSSTSSVLAQVLAALLRPVRRATR